MIKKDLKFIVSIFLSWRIITIIFLFFGLYFLPQSQNFLGGGMANYLKNPFLWAWANFDGEHYLSIAQNGYGNGEQAFFPLYPLLIKILGGSVWAGLIISNMSFLVALYGFYKLIRIDFSEKVSKLVLILFLLFPTSFYFGAVYTESLFLALVVWSFYFFRKEKYLFCGILGAFASATRVIGIILLPVLLIEVLLKKKKLPVGLFLIPLGLFIYMYYLRSTMGDPLAFLHSLPGFGEQRSAVPIILPQVFYRYFFKILPNLNYSYFQVVFTTYLEFIVGIFFLLLSLIAFFKLRISYALYLFLGYLIPTLSGSFSSLTRYVIVLFPAFILMAVWVNKINWPLRLLIYLIFFVLLGISTILFTRGYWIA